MNQMNEKILLVEDNETLGYILKEYLEMKGFDVDLAIDGTQGLRRFQKSPFDLCILDVMDGIDPRTSSRKVLGIDIDIREHNRSAIDNHPLSFKIDMLQGSSIDEKIVEQVKDFAITKEEWTVDNNLLTPTMKMKRKNILQNYKELHDKIYNL